MCVCVCAGDVCVCMCVDREQGEGLSKTGLVVICPAKWARLVIQIISI